MMMGATGSGKTTLINGMINYILGVQWEDKFRFKLIHEETNWSQAESQTSDVTAYVVNHQKGFKVPYSLTIIDTPGFGDTRGIEHDKLITQKIRDFFSTPGGIDHIDSVCFVVKAPEARLTPTQKYVFEAVLSIFGKDIQDNIQILVTFADGQNPPVLEAIKEAKVPCAKDAKGTPIHYKFNNSALFTSSSGECASSFSFDEMFWKMGEMGMKTFFDSLSKLETKSLTLTKEVLRERKELETLIAGLQPQIKAALLKMEEVKTMQQVLDQHKKDIAAGKNIEYEGTEAIRVKEKIDTYASNCNTCNVTCHYPCMYSVGCITPLCSAINFLTRRCNICPGKCPLGDHSLQKYRFVDKVEKKKWTFEELKQTHMQDSGGMMTTEQVLERTREQYEAEKETLKALMDKSFHSLQRLQEIAMKPKPLSPNEYIDLILQGTDQELNPQHQERVQLLKELRGPNKSGVDLQEASGNPDPSEKIQKIEMTSHNEPATCDPYLPPTAEV